MDDASESERLLSVKLKRVWYKDLTFRMICSGGAGTRGEGGLVGYGNAATTGSTHAAMSNSGRLTTLAPSHLAG